MPRPQPPRLVIVSVAEALWLRVPLVPVTVMVKVPRTPTAVWMVSVDDPGEGGSESGFALNLAVAPEGRPLAERLTDPLKLLLPVIVTVYVVELPFLTDRDDGLIVTVKSGGGAVTVTLALPLTLPLAAVTVKGPPAVEPAVNRPVELMVPPPLTDQVNVGCGLIGLWF